MKYWRLAERAKSQSQDGFQDRTADSSNLAIYAQAENAEEAFIKFESLCGPVRRDEFMAVETVTEDIPEDETIL